MILPASAPLRSDSLRAQVGHPDRSSVPCVTCSGGPSLKEAWLSRGRFSWFFGGRRVLSADAAGCCVCEGCSEPCVWGLPTVLSRVRSQSSFGFPIAPRSIPSWILLLHGRSHPTCSSARNCSFYDRPARHGSSQSHPRHRALARPNAEIQSAHSD